MAVAFFPESCGSPQVVSDSSMIEAERHFWCEERLNTHAKANSLPRRGKQSRYLFFLPLGFVEAEIKPSFATHHSNPTNFFYLHSPRLPLLSYQHKFNDRLHNTLLLHNTLVFFSPKSLSLRSTRHQRTSLMSPCLVGGMEAPVYSFSTLSLSQWLCQGGWTFCALCESFAVVSREMLFFESLHCFANMQKRDPQNS